VYDNDGISVVGGLDRSGHYMDTVSEYNFSRKEWMKDVVKLNHGVSYAAAAILSGELHSFGGYNDSNIKYHLIITTPRHKMYQYLIIFFLC